MKQETDNRRIKLWVTPAILEIWNELIKKEFNKHDKRTTNISGFRETENRSEESITDDSRGYKQDEVQS